MGTYQARGVANAPDRSVYSPGPQRVTTRYVSDPKAAALLHVAWLLLVYGAARMKRSGPAYLIGGRGSLDTTCYRLKP